MDKHVTLFLPIISMCFSKLNLSRPEGRKCRNYGCLGRWLDNPFEEWWLECAVGAHRAGDGAWGWNPDSSLVKCQCHQKKWRSAEWLRMWKCEYYECLNQLNWWDVVQCCLPHWSLEFLLQILGSSFLVATSQDPVAYEDGLHAMRRGEAIAVAVWESSGRLFPVSSAWARDLGHVKEARVLCTPLHSLLGSKTYDSIYLYKYIICTSSKNIICDLMTPYSSPTQRCW